MSCNQSTSDKVVDKAQQVKEKTKDGIERAADKVERAKDRTKAHMHYAYQEGQRAAARDEAMDNGLNEHLQHEPM
jgi:ABC-type hemin transport system substrate-binding protein